jgi:ATP-dependent protease HslVU (ClpYQ) ATPase subunit
MLSVDETEDELSEALELTGEEVSVEVTDSIELLLVVDSNDEVVEIIFDEVLENTDKVSVDEGEKLVSVAETEELVSPGEVVELLSAVRLEGLVVIDEVEKVLSAGVEDVLLDD